MTGFLFDTNVLLDIATADETWWAWSEEQFRTATLATSFIGAPPDAYEQSPATS